VDNGTGPVTLIKTGVASVKIDGHNTYSGGTFINQGRFQMAGGEPGDPNPDGLGTGRVTVAPGGYLFISSVNSATVYTGRGALTGENPVGGTAQNAPVLNDMTLSGNGTSQEAGGSIRFGNRSVLLGELTLAGDTRWCAGNAVSYNTRINTDGTLYVDPGNDIRGRITGPGALDFGGRAVAGFQGQISSTANDYSGNTTILPFSGAAILRLGNDEVIPHGVGKGSLLFGDNNGAGTNNAILDMNGHNETVNGLSTATATFLAGAIVQNNGFSAVVVDPTPGDPVNKQ
jgi:autotransporter-associated beta strand protein